MSLCAKCRYVHVISKYMSIKPEIPALPIVMPSTKDPLPSRSLSLKSMQSKLMTTTSPLESSHLFCSSDTPLQQDEKLIDYLLSIAHKRHISCNTEILRTSSPTRGDIPIYALVVDSEGNLIGLGGNERELTYSPIDHAEITALRQAAQTRRGWNLEDCTLAVTLEPCPMCAGAIAQAHIKHVAFGAWNPKTGACGSVWDILRDPHIGPNPSIRGGIRRTECEELLGTFFKTLNTSQKFSNNK